MAGPDSTGGRGPAVLAHGAGSSGDFLRRAFGPALAAAGWDLRVVEDRSGSVDVLEQEIAAAVRRLGATLVGGVSLGAHAAARWAAGSPTSGVSGLLLALPAWTGPPGDVAAGSAAAGAAIDSLGTEAVLRAVRDGSWVGEELARAWPAYGDALADALRSAALSPGPTPEDLRAVNLPVGVVGLRGDAFHPVEVAREWAATLPLAGLVELEAEEPAREVAALGRAGLHALARAVEAQGSKR